VIHYLIMVCNHVYIRYKVKKKMDKNGLDQELMLNILEIKIKLMDRKNAIIHLPSLL
jgi:uncharacterized protein YaaW (UPF0174 family)